jgi:hypothetical protein
MVTAGAAHATFSRSEERLVPTPNRQLAQLSASAKFCWRNLPMRRHVHSETKIEGTVSGGCPSRSCTIFAATSVVVPLKSNRGLCRFGAARLCFLQDYCDHRDCWLAPASSLGRSKANRAQSFCLFNLINVNPGEALVKFLNLILD